MGYGERAGKFGRLVRPPPALFCGPENFISLLDKDLRHDFAAQSKNVFMRML
jgi:hypothetical protein